MVLKNIVPAKRTSFTRGVYYWLMFMIDSYRDVRRMLKIDYESFIILQTVISHFLHSMNKEEDSDYKVLQKLLAIGKSNDENFDEKMINKGFTLAVRLMYNLD